MCDLELTSLMRSLARGRIITDERAEESLALYLSLPLLVHATRPLLARIWSFRHNFSAHDASYVGLAEALDANLLTADGGLAAAVTTHTAVGVVGL